VETGAVAGFAKQINHSVFSNRMIEKYDFYSVRPPVHWLYRKPNERRVAMKCPVCKTPDLSITERQSIEIDYCPTCRGVWLDRGELDKLLARVDDEAAEASRARPRDDAWRHDGYGHSDHRGRYDTRRKKKSLFEMFDFD
jgi:Zn-finger nucleic acid-binding protein